MSDRPSALHRTFMPGAAGLFEIVAGDQTFTDDQITSLKITRGDGAPSPTVEPATAEFTLTGAVNITRNTPLRVKLSNTMASRLAYGAVTGTQILDRFNGRKATATIDDQRWRNGDTRPAKWTTTATASSWTALLRNASRTNAPLAGYSTASALYNALNHPDVAAYQPVTYGTLTKADLTATTRDPMSFTDVMGDYAEKLGTLVQHRRNGSVHITPITQRRDDLAASAAGPAWTILRSHALSPATWSSPSEQATTQFAVRYTNEAGNVVTDQWPLSDEVSVIPLKNETVDIEYVKTRTDSIRLMMGALNRHTNISRFGVESVTFDLGMLWRIGTQSALTTMTHVLLLEHGAPVHLGADWPQGVRGPYFATGIEESVTPSSWTITLTLAHARYVLGLADVELVFPPAITWDANDYTWDAAPGAWDDYA